MPAEETSIGNTPTSTTASTNLNVVDPWGGPPRIDEYTKGFMKGYDVATSRAQSRHELGLEIERGR